MNLKIGCCGFPRGKEDYFEKFNMVELQDTFTEMPSVDAARALREKAPAGFEFSMKVWQVITHESSFPGYADMKTPLSSGQKAEAGYFKPTETIWRAWERTEEIADVLEAKVLLFDCPDLFLPKDENIKNIADFFRKIENKDRIYAWMPPGGWSEDEIKSVSEETGLVHCVDPFDEASLHGKIGYFRLHDKKGPAGRHTGMDMKKLSDFCESRSKELGEETIYVLFDNRAKMNDAMRFEWIANHTGLIKDISVEFLSGLCREIEAVEEDEKVQLLSREAEKIVNLILHTEYAKVDIEIESGKLKQMCKELFPAKEYLYDMIYGQRFQRLWNQFRETEGSP